MGDVKYKTYISEKKGGGGGRGLDFCMKSVRKEGECRAPM